MRMAGYYIDTIPALIIPYSHGLIIRGRQNPRQLVVEECCSDVIDMAFKHKQTSFLFVVPYSYIAIICP